MSDDNVIDLSAVKRTAALARLAIDDVSAQSLTHEISALLRFVGRLNTFTDGGEVPPDLRSTPLRPDVVTDTAAVAQIISNAPDPDGHFFTVPKVIE